MRFLNTGILFTILLLTSCTANEFGYGLTKGIRFKSLDTPRTIEIRADFTPVIQAPYSPPAEYINYMSQQEYATEMMLKLEENLEHYNFTVVESEAEFLLVVTRLELEETIDQETINNDGYDQTLYLSNVDVTVDQELSVVATGERLSLTLTTVNDYEKAKDKNNGNTVERDLDDDIFVDLIDRACDKIAGKSVNRVLKYDK